VDVLVGGEQANAELAPAVRWSAREQVIEINSKVGPIESAHSDMCERGTREAAVVARTRDPLRNAVKRRIAK
jgi:hypothetical protein